MPEVEVQKTPPGGIKPPQHCPTSGPSRDNMPTVANSGRAAGARWKEAYPLHPGEVASPALPPGGRSRTRTRNNTSFHRQFSEQGGDSSSSGDICCWRSSQIYRQVESYYDRSSDFGCCHRFHNSVHLPTPVQAPNPGGVDQVRQGPCGGCLGGRDPCLGGRCHCAQQHYGVLQSCLHCTKDGERCRVRKEIHHKLESKLYIFE